jgi:hypothetical protein
MKGICLKCGIYDDVEHHHILPRRWFGNGRINNWTEPLCKPCHTEADRITLDIDSQFQIQCGQSARQIKDLYGKEFVRWMNTCAKCQKPLESSRVVLMTRSYHLNCLLSSLRSLNGHLPKIVHSDEGQPILEVL